MTRARTVKVQARPRPPRRCPHTFGSYREQKIDIFAKILCVGASGSGFVYADRGDAFPDKRSYFSGLQLIVIVNAS